MILSNVICYLCSPVEHNQSANWRDEFEQKIIIYGIKPLNPLKKPSWVPPESLKMLALGDVLNNNISARSSIYDRQLCLRQVAISDIIVVYIPSNKPFTVGVIEEVIMAKQQNKPIYFIYKDGCPSTWLYSMFPESDIWFKNFNNFYKFLDKINNQTIKLDPIKWLFLYYKNQNFKKIKQHIWR